MRKSLPSLLLAAAVAAAALNAPGAESKPKKAASASKGDATSTPKKKAGDDGASASSKAKDAGSSKPKATPAASKKADPATPKPKSAAAASKPKPKSPSKPEQGSSDTDSRTAKEKVSDPPVTPAPAPAVKSNASDVEVGAPLPKKDPPAAPTAAPAPSAEAGAAAPQASGNGAETPASSAGLPKGRGAPPVSIATSDLLGFDDQPPRVQRLIESALALTKRNLTYTFGSADPNSGGMDCSGAVYYLLREHGFTDVPRDAAGQYVWARKQGRFFAVVSKKSDGFEFADLLPGDLLFWSGTYSTDRDPPISHTMIYLGVQRRRGQHVMWGSSDGRTYDGKPRWGVSVFDFKMPKIEPAGGAAKVDFVGYARIPGLREEKAPAPATAAATQGEEDRMAAAR